MRAHLTPARLSPNQHLPIRREKSAVCLPRRLSICLRGCSWEQVGLRGAAWVPALGLPPYISIVMIHREHPLD